jgi:hypothetical protein
MNVKHNVEWFTVQVQYSDRVPFELFGELEKGSLFMSAGGRLCGPEAAASLDSQQLAVAYLQALAIRRKKTDPEFKAVAIQLSSSHGYAQVRIEQDSNKVREKLIKWGVEVQF